MVDFLTLDSGLSATSSRESVHPWTLANIGMRGILFSPPRGGSVVAARWPPQVIRL
jgi:hypothetical protein